jgi:hypothetical protein
LVAGAGALTAQVLGMMCRMAGTEVAERLDRR